MHYLCGGRQIQAIMEIFSAQFRTSSSKIEQIPQDSLPEFAFIGRSNVGKSSLINMLTGRQIAKVSGTPGKTRLINHFTVNDRWYLVDLPGYGYARVSKEQRSGFAKIITDYITLSSKMYFLFVLVDSRLEPQKIDMEFIRMLGEQGIPFGLVFTKTDKLSAGKLSGNLARYKKRLLESWEELPPVFVTSSENKVGRSDILVFIEKCLTEC